MGFFCVFLVRSKRDGCVSILDNEYDMLHDCFFFFFFVQPATAWKIRVC